MKGTSPGTSKIEQYLSWEIALMSYLKTGGNGPFQWPASSPDETPFEYSIWGYVEGKAYQHPIKR